MNDFSNLGGEVARQLGEPTTSRSAEQRLRFVRAAASPRPAPAWQRPALWSVAAAAVVAIGLGAMFSWREPATGSTATTSAASAPEPRSEVWLQGAEQSGPVTLDEEATLELSSTARARLQRLSPARRQLTIENGRMKVELDPGSNRQWAFLAGAYRVEVVGTIFTVDYDPSSGALEVAVSRGRVRVSGGTLGAQSITLEAGQRFGVAGNTVKVERPGQEQPPAAARARSAAGPAADDVEPPEPEAPSWRTLHQGGDYAAALAAAEREGFDALVHGAGPAELSDLADVARLAGSSGRARQALLALRERFAGSAAAAKAAFLLGRMQGTPRWFATYLREQPAGAYAPEAAGRLMVAYRDTGDLGRARAAARQYLDRYPQGAYAELARSLVARPAPRH